MVARSWYVRVWRPFLQLWFFGVFLSGGGTLAAATMLTKVMGSNEALANVESIGQVLVFLGLGLLLFEQLMHVVIRRLFVKPVVHIISASADATRRTA